MLSVSHLIYETLISKLRYVATNSLFSFEGLLCTFSWVLSLLSRYFYNMYKGNMFEIVFSFNVKDNNIFPCLPNIWLSYNTSMLCQSKCACLHKTVNMAVFFVKSNENTYPKGRALMQMHRVVPITKRRNSTKISRCIVVRLDKSRKKMVV